MCLNIYLLIVITPILQMRLDFSNFVITGPSTAADIVAKTTNGVTAGVGLDVAAQTQCL
jgi:hypothetical protein